MASMLPKEIAPTRMTVDDLDTPALLVNLDAFERNVERMAGTFRQAGVSWRPHTKGIKVPAIAQRLIDAGAIGVTCAKVSEAEVMANGGIRDILIANQVVGEKKVKRLAELCRIADVIVAVDTAAGVAELDRAAGVAGTRPRVVVEVDTGMHRCGVEPGQAVVDLASVVASASHLRFAGVMAWEGHTAAITDEAEKRGAVTAAVALLTSSADACRRAGIPVSIVSCSGTGTYKFASGLAGITEVQAGGGVFGDIHYRDNYGVDHECSLTVMTTVVSRPSSSYIVTDGGFKTLGSINAMAAPIGISRDDVEKFSLSAEHGNLHLNVENHVLRPGDRLEWTVGYSDATVFMHDQIHATRNNLIEATWIIEGRGKLQ